MLEETRRQQERWRRLEWVKQQTNTQECQQSSLSIHRIRHRHKIKSIQESSLVGIINYMYISWKWDIGASLFERYVENWNDSWISKWHHQEDLIVFCKVLRGFEGRALHSFICYVTWIFFINEYNLMFSFRSVQPLWSSSYTRQS